MALTLTFLHVQAAYRQLAPGTAEAARLVDTP